MSTSNGANLLRALIVEDEAAIRRFVSKALKDEGFACDSAGDGQEAAKLSTENRYDLVVTDLALPGRNGHSLAVDLLAQAERPVIAVLTGVLEPRLAKDLIARGIDDILFKPIEFTTFAAKMRSLVDRRRKSRIASPTAPRSGTSSISEKLPRITADEFDSRLRSLTRVPPVSEAAIEVFKLTTTPDSELGHVAAAAQRDPALIAEILRLANSSFFNPSSHKITNLDQAIIRLGQKQVGELALATAAFATVTQEKIPFFPIANVWRDCLAAGICLEMLADRSENIASGCGTLFCAAMLAPMGRVMLASIFPEVYQRLLRNATKVRVTLAELEAQVFPVSTGDVVARALASWGIPDEVHRPLRHASMPFHLLSTLDDPLRRRVALLKTAGLLGKMGTGRWEDWDTVDLPSATTIKSLGIFSIDGIVSQCQQDLEAIASVAGGNAISAVNRCQPPTAAGSLLAYKRVQHESVDLLPHIFATTGIRLVNTVADVADIEGTVLINAFDAAVHQVVARVRSRPSHEILILADADNAGRLQNYGRVLSLPLSYGMLRETCSPVEATTAAAS
ncbi:MAG: HDOD domain-containing protein [Pirellulaceae bacterium]|nr:HDOD domain-containing protein [Pirellulaceae bacterium]